jgi:hypothetical protein
MYLGWVPTTIKLMDSDLNFFLELEELFNEKMAAGQVLNLNKSQRKRIKSSKLDYETFKFDFDLNCRFIAFFSGLEKKIYSKTHITLIKYVLIFSSFLKNRISLKLSAKNEILLEKATQNLTSTLKIHHSTLSSDIKTTFYDAGRILISFALVNIHEIYGISKSTPINLAARNFLNNEDEIQICEPSLVMITSKFNDFDHISMALDESVGSKAFSKYSKLPRPVYKESVEDRILLIFGIIAIISFIAVIICTEIILAKYFKLIT